MSKKYLSLSVLRDTNGFTLLELLIAISLSAVLMTVLVIGLAQITRDWEKQGKRLDQKIDESLLLLQLEKALIGTFTYRFKEHHLAKQELFFEGDNAGLSWVSTVSPDRNSGLALWHLQADADKGFRLNVIPAYPGNLHKQLEAVSSKEEQKMVYFKDYTISLHYLVVATNQKKQWHSSWSGKEKNKFPLGVKIQFEHQDNEAVTEMDFSVFSFIRANADGR